MPIKKFSLSLLNLCVAQAYKVSSPFDDLIDNQLESPDIFIRNNTFYITLSNSCALCSGSLGVVLRSESIKGPWQRNVISGYSCGGQLEGILTFTTRPRTYHRTFGILPLSPVAQEPHGQVIYSSPSNSTPMAQSKTSIDLITPLSPSHLCPVFAPLTLAAPSLLQMDPLDLRTMNPSVIPTLSSVCIRLGELAGPARSARLR